VEVNGAVKLPGRYPLTRGATATDLIKAAGGLLDSSYTVTAEISRANTSDPNQASVDIFNVDLARAYTNASLDVAMQGRDVLTVKQIPDYAERLTITLAGEVKFPGEYVVKKGDTLSQLIARAGGLTANAFPRGAVFTRERLKQLEAQRLKEAGERLQADLTAMELQGDEEKGKVEDVQQLKGLLEKVQTTRALGRLVIDVERLVANDAQQDVILQNG